MKPIDAVVESSGELLAISRNKHAYAALGQIDAGALSMPAIASGYFITHR